MTRSTAQEILENENPDAIFYEGLDEALIGIARRNGLCVVAYDQNKCYDILMAGGMHYDEAIEYFEYNVIGSYLGDHTPVFIG